MASNYYYPTSKNAIQKTLAAQLLSTASTGDAITFDDVDGVQNKPGVLVINRVDSNGTATPSSREFISFTGTSGNTVLIETRNVDSSGAARTHAVGSIVEFIADGVWGQRVIDQALVEHGVDGTHSDVTATSVTSGTIEATTSADLKTLAIDGGTAMTAVKDEDDMASNSATALATQQSIKAYVDAKKATGAEVTTGTEDAKFVTPKAISDAGVNTRLKSKTGTFTRDAAGTTANVAYTGVGFTPTSIVFTAVISGSVNQSVGFADSAKGGKVVTRGFDGNNYPNLYTNACIAIAQATGSNDQWAKVATYDADGFTLTWTKVNSPTGTITVDYIAYS